MRNQPAIQGYCVTAMTDIHWEVNGLLDMWRNEKVFAEELQRLQEPDSILARFPTVNFTAHDPVDVPVVLSHFSSRELADARVLWGTDSGQGGVLRIAGSIAPGTTSVLGNIRFSMPAVQTATRVVLTMTIRDKNGSRLCENTYILYAYPEPAIDGQCSIGFHDPLGTYSGLDFTIQRAGYKVVSSVNGGFSRDAIVLATTMDELVMGHLGDGGRVLLLADSEEALPTDSSLQCVKRAGTWLDGRWFSNYNWIDPSAQPYRELALQRLLGFESRRVVPGYVIAGVQPEDYDDVLSGISLGWLNLNNALTLQTVVGSGKALITTFRFSQYGLDPYATHLLNAYLHYLSSDNCRPRLQWNAKSAAVK
jgi:hypothetical protein